MFNLVLFLFLFSYLALVLGFKGTYLRKTVGNSRRASFGTTLQMVTTSRPSKNLFERLTQAATYLVEQPTRAQYATAMATRFAYFLSQSLVISQLPGLAARPAPSPTPAPASATLDVAAVIAAMSDALLVDSPDDFAGTIPPVSEKAWLGSDDQRALFGKNFASIINVMRRDLKNIESGIYKMPYDLELSYAAQCNPLRVATQASAYVSDRRDVLERSRRGAEGGLELREKFIGSPDKYPDYYLQNFHYQTDGWLSATSSQLYDYQVESLFMGTADAMRRQILPSMAQFFNDKQARGEKVAHLDVATGTGRFLSFVLQNYPDLEATCLDLSPFYLADAKTLLSKKYPQVKYCEAAAEKIPFPDASFDSISCVYLFHELPHEVRVAVVAEMARVLKPGGRVFFVDSAQKGEVPADRVLEGFTIIAHEPYYLNYTEEDLSSLFQRAGFEVNTSNVEWVSKCMTFTKNG